MKKLLSLTAAALVAFSANAALSNSDFSSNDYIKEWGRLQVKGTQLCDEQGNAIQLKGWSSFGWQNNWGDCHSEGAIKQMKAWGANVYRGAMYVEEGGYNSNKQGFIQITKDLIDKTAANGMYYLCDWHILTPGDPLNGVYSDYNNYFREITSYVKQKGYKHVLYEICNEPNGVSWDRIKEYANKVLPTISQGDPGAVVVVGTREWDQHPEEAANSPLSNNYGLNIMYSFHYYACSHAQLLSNYTRAARIIPVFITEWGVANFDGGQAQGRNIDDNCKNGAMQLMQNAVELKTSWCCWSFGEKAEQASALMSCGTMQPSTSGQYVIENFMGGNPKPLPQSACYAGECQAVPGVIDLGLYDVNPEGEAVQKGGLTSIGAGEGVAYHEENTTDDEINDGSLCNGAFKWGGEGFNFRPDECVDASNCYGLTNTEGWHNLGYIEPLEWEKYTLSVEEPGYYQIEGLVNPTTNQELSITSSTHGENLLYDIDTEEPLPSISFSSNLRDAGDNNWKTWEWETPVDNLEDANEINAGILFKEAEEKHTIRIDWGTGPLDASDKPTTKGDMGPLKLTKVKSYNGPGYEKTSVKEAKASSVVIYPNPASDVVYVQADVNKFEICNIAGCVVASSNVKSVNIANLAAGTYIAKVTLKDGSIVTKTIIKK